MNMQQWNKHQKHMDEHIKWPATKKEILDACQGMDVEPEILEEMKMKLPDGDKKYTKEDFMNMMMPQMAQKQM